MKTNKDNRIELYRFIFAIVIMLFHSHLIDRNGHAIPLGYVFVEFFFFLTGYFTYASLKKKTISDSGMATYPFRYTWRKFKRFIPYVFMTAVLYVVISFAGNHFIKHLSICDTIREFSGLPFDVLLLQVTGICRNPNFHAWWFLSAMLFTLPLVITLFYKKIRSGGVFIYIVYFVPLLIYGAFSVQINGLDWDREIFGIIRSGIFRGFAGLCVGCIIYDLKEMLCAKIVTNSQRIILTMIEIAAYSFSILISWKWGSVENSVFIILLLLIIGMTITFSNKSYTTGLDLKIFSYLGMISMPLYICHFTIGLLMERYFVNENIYVRYFLYFICTFAFSIFMLVIDKMISRGATK